MSSRSSVVAIGMLFVMVEAAEARVATRIIDASGDGAGNGLERPSGLAVDGAGNVYVAGQYSNNVFKVTPGGAITELIDATGDGAGNPLDAALGVAVDGLGNVYVTGSLSNNAFKIEPGGAITELIDASGDGAGNGLLAARAIAVDTNGDVFVAGFASDNVFKIAAGGGITEIIDASGDGAGHGLSAPHDLAIDGAGAVYVAGLASDNAFKITTGGGITEIISPSGDGAGHALDGATGVAVDGSGNAYVTAFFTNNAFRIAPGGAVTQIVDIDGAGPGQWFVTGFDVATDATDNVYVASEYEPATVLQVTPTGRIERVFGLSGEETGEPNDALTSFTADAAGRVYLGRANLGAAGNDVVLKVERHCQPLPQAGCRLPIKPLKARLFIKEYPDAAPPRRSLKWTWTSGQATTLADIGDPFTTDHYSLCIYEESGGPPELVFEATAVAGRFCQGSPCWRAKGTVGIEYADEKAAPDGMRRFGFKAGPDGRARVTVVGGPQTTLQRTPLPLGVPARVQAQGNGNCWEAVYAPAGVSRNDPTQFKGKGS